MGHQTQIEHCSIAVDRLAFITLLADSPVYDKQHAIGDRCVAGDSVGAVFLCGDQHARDCLQTGSIWVSIDPVFACFIQADVGVFVFSILVVNARANESDPFSGSRPCPGKYHAEFLYIRSDRLSLSFWFCISFVNDFVIFVKVVSRTFPAAYMCQSSAAF